ncbi:MAG: DNA adenine methylase, partial [Acetobacter sp.]|nr:DNA adenine methylase [Acetobacter sp.]
EEYREPFFGGGSVGIFISQIKQNITIKANDLNYDLYCFWISLKKTLFSYQNNKNNERALPNWKRSLQFYSFKKTCLSNKITKGCRFFHFESYYFLGCYR